MTAKDLIEQLQDLDPNTEIRLAIQPNYPFEHEIANELAILPEDRRGNQVAYLVDAGQIGYLPPQAAVACGWAEAEEDDSEYDYDTRDEELDFNENSDDDQRGPSIDRF